MVNPHTAESEQSLKTPNADQVVEVTPADLPVHCPLVGSSLWNSHPRVYIPVEENGGRAKCPYCGADYLLND